MGIFSRKPKPSVSTQTETQTVPELPPIAIGDTVTILGDDEGNSLEVGEVIGTVYAIRISPYYDEECEGIVRIYVVSKSWGIWALPEHLKHYKVNEETAIA